MTACMGCIFRRHDGDEVNQLLELLMRETKDERSPIRSMANDYNIQNSRNEAEIYSVNLLLKEFLILVLELLENIIVVKKFLYRAVGLV